LWWHPLWPRQGKNKWLAFVLMLMIFHHPKANTVCLVSFFARKKNICHFASIFFFLARKLTKQKGFLSDNEKSSASVQRQATHTGKISG
jgi:hypothetical protein